MRSSTIILADLALRHSGVRAAARASGQPVSSIAGALTRLERDLGLPLVRRSEDGIALTIDAQRRAPAIARLAHLCRQILACGAEEVPADSISFIALFRLAETLRVGSIRRAAQQMGLAQPQLTRQISQLERTLARPLALRGARGVEPAPEGRALLRLIEQIEAEWRALSRSAEPASSQVSRRYALGSIVPANPTGDLAALLAQIGIDLFLRHGLRISIASTLAEDLLVGLDTGRFDCIFIDAEMSDPGYSLMRLQGGRVAMVGADLPADHDRDALRSALARRPLVLQSRRSGLRQRAEAFLDQFAGEDWRTLGSLIEIDSLPVIVNMVLSGAVVGFLPLHAVAGGGGISVLALPEPFDQRLSLAWRSTPKGRRLAYIIRATLAARGWAENGGVWLPVTDVADPADG